MLRIAYYAHHMGSGHLQHAANVVRSDVGETLVITSGSSTNEILNAIRITPDVVAGHTEPRESPFHYTPNDSRIRQRFSEIHRLLDDFAPDVVISDVSAEIAIFCRLAGYPVITRRMHGTRDDRAHLNMYDAANALLAYYPKQLESDALLTRHREKTFFAGMLEPNNVVQPQLEEGRVVVLSSLGGKGIDLDALSAAAATTPDWTWSVVGKTFSVSTAANIELMGTVRSPEVLLSKASIVICSAGHNAVRVAAAAGVPLITVPEDRPHDEQLLFARALQKQFGIPCATRWDQNWKQKFAEAEAVDLAKLREDLFTTMPSFKAELKRAIDFAISS